MANPSLRLAAGYRLYFLLSGIVALPAILVLSFLSHLCARFLPRVVFRRIGCLRRFTMDRLRRGGCTADYSGVCARRPIHLGVAALDGCGCSDGSGGRGRFLENGKEPLPLPSGAADRVDWHPDYCRFEWQRGSLTALATVVLTGLLVLLLI